LEDNCGSSMGFHRKNVEIEKTKKIRQAVLGEAIGSQEV